MTIKALTIDEVLDRFDLFGCDVYREPTHSMIHRYNLKTCTKYIGKIIDVRVMKDEIVIRVQNDDDTRDQNYFRSFEYDYSIGAIFWRGRSSWLILIGECGSCKHDCKRGEECEFYEESGK